MSFRVKWSVYAGISSMMDRTRCDDDDGNRNGAQCVCVCARVCFALMRMKRAGAKTNDRVYGEKSHKRP